VQRLENPQGHLVKREVSNTPYLGQAPVQASSDLVRSDTVWQPAIMPAN
jgi:hypothetical protein